MSFFLNHLYKIPFIVPISIALCAGVIAQSYLPNIFILLCYCYCMILIFFAIKNQNSLTKNIYIFLSFLIGASILQQQNNHVEALRNFMQEETLNLTVEITDYDKKQHPFIRHVYTGTILHALQLQSGKSIKPEKSIKLYTQKPIKADVGSTIKIFNYKAKPIANNQFAEYCKKEKIITTHIGKSINYAICNNKKYFAMLRSYIYHLRFRMLQHLKNKFSQHLFIFYSLLFLGKKPSNQNELQHLHTHGKEWGVSHHFARSGLHLIICLLAWERLLGYIPLSLYWQHIILLLFGIVYYFLSWSTISFKRAFIVFSCTKFALAQLRPTHSMHLIGVALIYTITTNPWAVFFLDFQLSFGITMLLCLASNVLKKRSHLTYLQPFSPSHKKLNIAN